MLAALFLTYRRGGAVLVAPLLENATLADTLQNLSTSLHTGQITQGSASASTPVALAAPSASASFSVWGSVEAGFAVALSHSTTAEQLSNMYNACLTLWNVPDRNVATLCVGVGPGSFTGLRLGCAFANGLAMVHHRRLVAVPCPVKGQPEAEFSQFVTFDDILGALTFLKVGQGLEVATFVPAYGSEPGPVLKLQEQLKLANLSKYSTS